MLHRVSFPLLSEPQFISITIFYSLNTELAFVKANSDVMSFSVWAAGAFETSYTLSVTPNADGSDQALWTQAGTSLLFN